MAVWFISSVIYCALIWTVHLLEMVQMAGLAPPQVLSCSLGRLLLSDSRCKGFSFLILPSFASQTCLAKIACQAEVVVVSAGAAVVATVPSEFIFIFSAWGSVIDVLITGCLNNRNFTNAAEFLQSSSENIFLSVIPSRGGHITSKKKTTW